MRLAIAGAGTRASHHLLAAQALGAEIVLVEYRRAAGSRFAAEHGISHVFDSMNALWAKGGADAVCLCPPYTSHAAACLKSGLPVLIEPPFAVDADAARELMCISEHTGTLLMAALRHRFDPDMMWLRAQIEAGVLGRILRTRGGGPLSEAGVDAVDMARFLQGDPEPTGVDADIDRRHGECAGAGESEIVITWANGAASIVADGPDGAIDVCGTHGFGRSDPARCQYLNERGESVVCAPPEIERSPDAAYMAQMAHFLECAGGGAQACIDSTHLYLSMCMVDAAFASARIGRVIEL